MKEYVIIGNGVAGATAAEKIRANDPQGKITIYSKEPEPFYYRVRLPEAVAGLVGLDRMTIHDQKWHDNKNIDLLLGEKAVEVDPDNRTVLGEKGSKRRYDALLLAAGARCFIPPVNGADKKGVFSLRTWADAVQISARAEQSGSAVLVGGGLLGLEAAYGLTRRGVSVSVVEFFDRLLPRQLCARSAAKLQKHLEKMGFTFYLGARAKQILGEEEAAGLALEDGQEIPGGLVLFSAGIRPNLDLARDMGLEMDKGIKVDDRLMTSREGVWAAGDLIEHRGGMYGLWIPAKEQGEAAGINMAGGSVLYEGTIISSLPESGGGGPDQHRRHRCRGPTGKRRVRRRRRFSQNRHQGRPYCRIYFLRHEKRHQGKPGRHGKTNRCQRLGRGHETRRF